MLFKDESCKCKDKVLTPDEISKSRTALRCVNCRNIVGYWDSETEEEQEKRISNYYNREHDNKEPFVWSTEDIHNLMKKSIKDEDLEDLR